MIGRDLYDPFAWRRTAHAIVDVLEDWMGDGCVWGFDYTAQRIFIDLESPRIQTIGKAVSFYDSELFVDMTALACHQFYNTHASLVIQNIRYAGPTGPMSNVTHSLKFRVLWLSSSQIPVVLESYDVYLTRCYFVENSISRHRPLSRHDSYINNKKGLLGRTNFRSAFRQRKFASQVWSVAMLFLRYRVGMPAEIVRLIGQFVFAAPHIAGYKTRYQTTELAKLTDVKHKKRRLK